MHVGESFTLEFDLDQLNPISFFVKGKPEPAGSKKAVSIPGRRFTQVVDANKHAPKWKKTVGGVADYTMKLGNHRIIQVPCCVKMEFVLPRPKHHWLASGELGKAGVEKFWPTSPPDALKLARAVEDGMTGFVYIDDALIVHEVIDKRYQTHPAEQIGVQVYVWRRRHDPLRAVDNGVPHRPSPGLRSA